MKVLISGYYGFGNLGDEALLSGLIDKLLEHGHSPTILSKSPRKTTALHGVHAVHRLKAVAPALWQADAFISGGGGLLQDKTSGRSLKYYLNLISLAKRLGKRPLIYGQSIGPLSQRGSRSLVKALAEVPIAVRDQTSQRRLEDLGLSASLVADTALLLKRPDIETLHNKSVLLIPRGGYPEITQALIKLGWALSEKDIPIVATMMHPEEDQEELENLKQALPHLRIRVVHSPEEAIEFIANVDFVVSSRLHGLILAAVAGRGFCGLVYDPKVEAFLQEAQAPAFTLPIDENKLIKCVMKMPPLNKTALDHLHKRANQGISWLVDHLG